jgi:predicted aspartyl protease
LLQGHLVVVKAFLPGVIRKANLLIDTGATATVVSRDLANRLDTDRISDKGVAAKASATAAVS